MGVQIFPTEYKQGSQTVSQGGSRSFYKGRAYSRNRSNFLNSSYPLLIIGTMVCVVVVICLFNKNFRILCARKIKTFCNHIASRVSDISKKIHKKTAQTAKPDLSKLTRKELVKFKENRLYQNEEEAIKSLKKQTERAKSKLVLEKPIASKFNAINIESPPKKDFISDAVEIDQFEVGICYTEGRRKTQRSYHNKKSAMEDRHLVTSIDSTKCPGTVFAVFDGHAGASAAEFLREHLKHTLENNLEKSLSKNLTTCDLMNALKNTIIQLDRDYTDESNENADSGTTCTLVFFPKKSSKYLNNLHHPFLIANTGDSRAVHSKPFHTERLTADANLSDPDFLKSIYIRGGEDYILKGRIYSYPIKIKKGPNLGSFEVARAIGNRLLKTVEDEIRLLPCRPKISYGDLESSDERLLVFSDGLTQVVNTQEMAQQQRNLVKLGKTNKEIAENLVYASYLEGSDDNITLLVISLKNI